MGTTDDTWRVAILLALGDTPFVPKSQNDISRWLALNTKAFVNHKDAAGVSKRLTPMMRHGIVWAWEDTYNRHLRVYTLPNHKLDPVRYQRVTEVFERSTVEKPQPLF